MGLVYNIFAKILAKAADGITETVSELEETRRASSKVDVELTVQIGEAVADLLTVRDIVEHAASAARVGSRAGNEYALAALSDAISRMDAVEVTAIELEKRAAQLTGASR